jgi:hypothetical protein
MTIVVNPPSSSPSFLEAWSDRFWDTPFNLNDIVNVAAGLSGPFLAPLAQSLVVSTEAAAVETAAARTIDAGGALPAIATGVALSGAAGLFREIAGAAFATAASETALGGVAALVAAGFLAPELAVGAGVIAAVSAAYLAGREIVTGIDTLTDWLNEAESSGQTLNETLPSGGSISVQPTGAYTLVTPDAVYYYDHEGSLTNVLIQGNTASPLFGALLTIDNATNTVSATDIDGNPIGVQVVVDSSGNSTIIDSTSGNSIGTMTGTGLTGFTVTGASGDTLNIPAAGSGDNPTVVQQGPDGATITTTIEASNGAVTAVATAADGSVISTTDSVPNGLGNGYTLTTTDANGNVSVQTTSLDTDGGSSTSTRNYNAEGALIGSIEQTVTSDQDGSLTSTTTNYDGTGVATSMTVQTESSDASGGRTVVTQSYDAAGALQDEVTQVTEANGVINSHTVNADGTSTSSVNDGTQTITSAYTASGQLTSQLVQDDGDAFNSTKTFLYNGDGTIAEVQTSDSNGATSDAIYAYGSGSTSIETTDFQSGVATTTSTETITPTNDGGFESITDAYDSTGALQSQATQTVDPSGQSTTTTAYPDGTYTRVVDNGAQTVSDHFTSGGQLQSESTENDVGTAGGGVSTTTSYEYNSNGTISQQETSSPDGSSLYKIYDGNGDLQSSESFSPNGASEQTTYNSLGQVTQQTESFAPAPGEVYGGSYTVDNNYDTDGYLISSQSDGRSAGDYGNQTETIVNTSFDGSAGTVIDARTYVANQLTTEAIQSDAGTETSTFTYQPNGSLDQTVTSNQTPDGTVIGQTTQFAVDPSDATQTASQVVQITPPSSDSESDSPPVAGPVEVTNTVTYDAFGNRVVNGVIDNGTLGNNDNGGNGFGPGNGANAGSDGLPPVSFDPDDGSYSGGYAFAGGSNAGAGVNVGEIAKYDFANGDYASGVAALQAAQDANVTENSPSPTGQEAFLEGAKWGSQVITWSLASVTGSGSGPFSSQISSNYLSTIQSAFATWSAATGITFEQVADSAQSDVRIGWSNLDTSNTGVLGYTGYEQNGSQITGAAIRLEDPTQDALVTGTGGSQTYSGTQTTLQQLLLHEIGHVLGLADSSDPSSIMYATLGSTNTSLTSGDIAAVAGLYSNNAVLGISSTVEHESASGQVISEYTQNTDGSALTDAYNADNQLIQKNVVNVDGSSNDSTYSYNADGSYSDTVVTTAVVGGTPSTTVYDYDSQGNLVDNPPANFFQATQANQTVSGQTSGPDTLEGGFANDILAGASGQDTFIYNLGSGAEALSESAPISASSNNTLQFGSGITPDMLSVSMSNDSQLVVEVGSSGDSITIDGFNPTDPLNTLAVQQFDFSDGTSLSLAQLLSQLSSASSGSFDNADGSSTSYSIVPAGDDDGDVYTALTVDTSNRPTSEFYIGTDGTTETDTWTWAPDGSVVYTQVDPPGNTWTGNGLTQDYNADGQLVSQSIAQTDGSTDTTTFSYAPDGSKSQTEVDTAANGSIIGTTAETFDLQGNELTQIQDAPDGSTVSFTWTYNNGVAASRTEVDTPAGGGTGSTEVQEYNAQGQIISDQGTNADGSTASYVWVYNDDGSYTQTDVLTYAGDLGTSTTVHDFDPTGQQLSQNTYTPQSDGSYVDYWSKSDSSQGQYWWNASSLEYQDTWQNADGSSFTDDYQYASGGTPGGTGVSFTETYSDSSGDQGTRQFNASTDMTTITWNSAQTGNISEAISGDVGFVGLTTNGELTNSQNDPTFFNPAVSPTFAALLAAH